METILVNAQELTDDGIVGDNCYFLSYGRTIRSARNNIIKYLNGIWYRYEYKIYDQPGNLMDFLLDKYWEYCRPASTRTGPEKEEWIDLFAENANFTFPRGANRAGICEITESMADKLLEYIEDIYEKTTNSILRKGVETWESLKNSQPEQ